jgi:diguanylate cyclase (GGDEF)-like protein
MGTPAESAPLDVCGLRRQLANYAMAVDLLGRMVQCASEDDVIAGVVELFEELCAPDVLAFVPIHHEMLGAPVGRLQPGVAQAKAIRSFLSSGAAHASTHSGSGFMIRVAHHEATLGLLVVDAVAFPDRRDEYLNLTLAVVGVVALAIANARTHQLLQAEAVTDELTGIANRRAATRRLWEELARSRRTGEQLAVLMLDLDHFKDVNDRYGHIMGDAVLRATAARMQAAVRQYDTLCRVGGEEFLILAPRTGLTQATRLGDRIRRAVGGSALLTIQGHSLVVTVSGGVAVASGRDVTVDMLLARADQALYRAKSGGRDRIVADRPDLDGPRAASQ